MNLSYNQILFEKKDQISIRFNFHFHSTFYCDVEMECDQIYEKYFVMIRVWHTARNKSHTRNLSSKFFDNFRVLI